MIVLTERLTSETLLDFRAAAKAGDLHSDEGKQITGEGNRSSNQGVMLLNAFNPRILRHEQYTEGVSSSAFQTLHLYPLQRLKSP